MLITVSRITLMIGLAGLVLLVSNSCRQGAANPGPGPSLLTEDEKHRLYAAALAASESPLDTATFKDVCRKIGIFDEAGQPNDYYMTFVSEHINWGMKSKTEEFRQQIDTKEKARAYVSHHLR